MNSRKEATGYLGGRRAKIEIVFDGYGVPLTLEDFNPLAAVGEQVLVDEEHEVEVAQHRLVLGHTQPPAHPLDDQVFRLAPGGVDEVVDEDVNAGIEDALRGDGDRILFRLRQLV